MDPKPSYLSSAHNLACSRRFTLEYTQKSFSLHVMCMYYVYGWSTKARNGSWIPKDFCEPPHGFWNWTQVFCKNSMNCWVIFPGPLSKSCCNCFLGSPIVPFPKGSQKNPGSRSTYTSLNLPILQGRTQRRALCTLSLLQLSHSSLNVPRLLARGFYIFPFVWDVLFRQFHSLLPPATETSI